MTQALPTALLARYLERIAYSGPVEPTLAVLQQLHLLHPQSIPFENLAPYTGKKVSLGIDAIAEKMLTQRRGGYCFEHNTLLLAVLREIGFQVTPLIARVRWQVPAEVETGLTHMLLRVDIKGRSWLADVAFGSTTQTAPLELLTDVPQQTPHGVFRLVQVQAKVQESGAGETLGLEFQTPAGWQTVYHYTLAPAAEVDFEIGNWYTSTHPPTVCFSADVAGEPYPARPSRSDGQCKLYQPGPCRECGTAPLCGCGRLGRLPAPALWPPAGAR
jgi:N-hydroxyarylamine O-acetyltransferase